ncbi:MAG: shikimate dehydrogenase [Rickettsiales bacterium]|jgi:shikimate dehydrogenase
MNLDSLREYILSPNTKIVAVIGDPIAQSLSPHMHNYWLKQCAIDGKYTSRKVSIADFPEFLRSLPKLGFVGCNITIPHKEMALKLCDFASKSALEIGAVNTITIDKAGKIWGDNSDYFGFIQNIKSTNPNFDFAGKRILLLGAGGAARAIIFGLLREGVSQIIVANRSFDKAENLAKSFDKTTAIKWEDRDSNLNEVDLLINSTSLGMKGSDDLEINLNNLNEKALVCDIVYKPLMTNLLKNAEKQGNPITTGIGMLIYQGLFGFEKWFGEKPEIEQNLINEMIELSIK